MDPIEARKLALREAVELCKAAPGYKALDVVHVADEIHQWLVKPEARPGKPIWNGKFGEVYADGLGVGPMDWPLVT